MASDFGVETGAAYLAGLGAEVFESLDQASASWQLDARFEPQMAAADRDGMAAGWRKAVAKVTGS